MTNRPARRPASNWPWWKALLASAVGFGIFGIIPGLLPPFSIGTMRFGLALAALIVVAAMWSWWNFNWWARVLAGIGWSLEILAIAARAWFLLLGISWIWILAVLAAYALALAMPVLWPRVSAILWREQTTPQTRAGRTALGVALAIGPSAGIIAASFGIFGSRSGGTDSVMIVMAILATAVAIGFAFAFAYQLWPERPWTTDQTLG